jgi:hypothetical protein
MRLSNIRKLIKPSKELKAIHVKLNKEIYDEANKYRLKDDMTMTSLIETLLQAYITDYKRYKKTS